MEPKMLTFDEVRAKVEALKTKNGVDLSNEEDLSIAVMNLISIEEHSFFTGVKTQKDDYFVVLQEARALRGKLLGKMIEKTEGETWCLSKHLLATSMRLMEVGTKLNGQGKLAEAKEMFEASYRMYSLFFALRLKVVEPSTAKEMVKADKAWTVDDIVTKLVDCCNE